MIKNKRWSVWIGVALLTFSSMSILAQQNVGIGTVTPNASAALEVESTDKGFLPPRLSTTGILNITSPAEGLVVYNSDSDELYVFNGAGWVNMSGRSIQHFILQGRLDGGETPIQIYNTGVSVSMLYGKIYQGGYIAYLDTIAGIGLIAATINQGSVSVWSSDNQTVGANGKVIGTGQLNTQKIITKYPSELGIAARLCSDYSVTVNGTTYNDWFLPSLEELNQLYLNLKVHGLGNFQNFIYWSSTEFSFSLAPGAETKQFASGLNGRQSPENRQNMYFVRPVREF